MSLQADPESLNWVNRQSSNGLKINRLPSKRGSFFYRQPSQKQI